MINATGVWADRLRPDELYGEEEVPRIRPSRSTHVILPRELLRVEAGRGRSRGAVGARRHPVLPWLGRTLVGTTDSDYEGGLEHIPAGESDVVYLLEALNAFFGLELGAQDLAGVRRRAAAVSTGDPKSVDISRKARLLQGRARAWSRSPAAS